MSITETDRRKVILGTALTAIAAVSRAMPALARPDAADPIFAAIEAHRSVSERAFEFGIYVWELQDDAYCGWALGSSWTEDGLHIDPDDPEAWRDALLTQREIAKEKDAATVALFTSEPTTLRGLDALLSYINEHRVGESAGASSDAQDTFYLRLPDLTRALTLI